MYAGKAQLQPPSTDSLKLNVAIQDTAEPLITLSIQDKLPSFECRSVVASQTPTRLGITELIQQSERRWSKQQCYALFASHGLHYGASHQQIDTVYVTKLGLLVELSSTLGSASAAQAGRLDSVFQASLLWHFEANEDASLLMPTAAAKVSFWAPLSEISYALLRENEGKPHCSIQLLGDDGTLLGELDGLQLCPQTPTGDVEMLLMPQWIGIEDPEHDHVDLNSKQSALLIGLPLAQETQARALFGTLRQRRSGPGRRHGRFKIPTRGLIISSGIPLLISPMRAPAQTGDILSSPVRSYRPCLQLYRLL